MMKCSAMKQTWVECHQLSDDSLVLGRNASSQQSGLMSHVAVVVVVFVIVLVVVVGQFPPPRQNVKPTA